MEQDLTHDERIDVAYRIFRAMRAQHPDRLIKLVDAQGCVFACSNLPEREQETQPTAEC
jgi:hypothetical protein